MLKTTPAFILTRRYELAFAREPFVHTLPRASPSPSSSRERGGGMLDAPPLRQAGRLQRVDEAPPPRDLHVGWELCVELGVGPMFEPNTFDGVGQRKTWDGNCYC